MLIQNGLEKSMKIKYSILLSCIILILCFFILPDNVFLLPDHNENKIKKDTENYSNNAKVHEIKIDTSIIIDSDYNQSEIFSNNLAIPDSIISQLSSIKIRYIGYDSLIHQGQIIVHHSISEEMGLIFNELLKVKFPIEKVIPIVYYNWDDDSSMSDNNTSSFNYRKVKNSNKLSTHALGLAIDINPRDNPFIDRHGNKSPPNGVYDSSRPGTITSSSQCYKIFEKYGWKWGGHWRYSKDYQHFSKYGK